MYIQLMLLGTGTPDDPFSVDLPSYSVDEIDYPNMRAIVSVGPRVGPAQYPPHGDPLFPLMGDKYVLIGLSPQQLTSWWARLAQSYPNRDVPFMPNFP